MGHPTQRNPFFLNPEKCSQITMEITQWSGHYRMPRHITTRLTKDPTNHDPQLLHKWYSLETYLLTKGSTLSGYNSRDRTSSHLYKTVLGLWRKSDNWECCINDVMYLWFDEWLRPTAEVWQIHIYEVYISRNTTCIIDSVLQTRTIDFITNKQI